MKKIIGLFLLLFMLIGTAQAELKGTNADGIKLISNAAALSWDASITPDVTYSVYVNDVKFSTTPINGFEYSLTLPASMLGQLVKVHITAMSDFGVESIPSNTQVFIPVPDSAVGPPRNFIIVITIISS